MVSVSFPFVFLFALIYSNLCAIHAKRITVMPKDMQLARRIRGRHDGLGWLKMNSSPLRKPKLWKSTFIFLQDVFYFIHVWYVFNQLLVLIFFFFLYVIIFNLNSYSKTFINHFGFSSWVLYLFDRTTCSWTENKIIYWAKHYVVT